MAGLRQRPHFASFAGCACLIVLATGVTLSSERRADASELRNERLAALGPAPRSDDGRFANPDGPLGHGSIGVRVPFLLRRMIGGDEAGRPERVANDGAALRARQGREPTATWVGHASLLVQMDGVSFLTDPNWSDTASPVSWAGPERFVPPGIAIADLPAIDFVLVSHNHYDHLDLPTLVALAERSEATRFFVPLGNAKLLRRNGIARVQEFDWAGRVEHAGVTIYCLPAQHWSKRSLTDDNKTLWSSWAVTGVSRRFYFAGDTGYSDHFARIGAALGPFDLAAVPIGAYEPVAMMQQSHMNPEQAAVAASELGGKRALAIHFGTFDLSDEALDEPPRRFRAAAAEAGFAAEDAAWVLKVGESRRF